MTEVVWNPLAKKVDDKTTISEEIDAKLLAHNIDVSAHSQSEEAIYNHRIADILDHLDGSVTTDKIGDKEVNVQKLFLDKYFYQCDWLSIDSWSYRDDVGDIIPAIGGGAVYVTSGTTNTLQYLYSYSELYSADFESRNPVLEFLAKTSYTTNQTIYWGMGDPDGDFAGFKIVNGAIYACVVAGSTETLSASLGLTPTILRTYRVEVFSGDRVEFYANNAIVHTYEGTMPTNDGASYLMFFTVTRTTASARSFRLGQCRIYQDK